MGSSDTTNKGWIYILTIIDEENYGNRLQNYALQTVLEEYGDVTTLYHYRNAATSKDLFKEKIKRLVNPLRFKVLSCLPGHRGLKARRRLSGHRFTKQFIKDNKSTVSALQGAHLFGDNKKAIVIGSDQVWNPHYASQIDLTTRLGQFDAAVDKISYAASVGVDEITDAQKKMFSSALSRLKAISVREYQGKKLIEQLKGIDAAVDVVLDPTLLVNAEHWRSITRGSVKENDRYILTYFLGKPTTQQQSIIEERAKKNHCRIRKILDFSDPETYPIGSEDFVELIQKAEYIYTDSYHACCFSILFNRPFKVFNRQGVEKNASMNSRLETLFKHFEIDADMSHENEEIKLNYDRINELLLQKRKQSRKWLESSLDADSRLWLSVIQ